MKRLKVLVLVLLAFGLQASAQNTAEDRAKKMTEHLDQEVGLSEEQKQVITQLNIDFATQMMEMRKAEQKDKEAMMAMRKEHRKQVQAQLTDEQKATLKAKREEKKDVRKKMHKEIREYRKANIAPVMMEKRTDFDNKLTAEEKATIEKLRAEIKAKKAEYKKMSAEEKKAHRSKRDAEFKEKMKEERKAMRAQLKPILDAHKDDLAAIEEELAPLRKQWKEDIKNIKAKYQSNEPNAHRKGGKMQKAKGGKQHHEGAMKMKFILMDPAQPIEDVPGEH